MAFLKKFQITYLVERLNRLFTRVQQKNAKKKRARIFYALEPGRGFVHIVVENMMDKVLSTLSEQMRELKKFKSGKLFTEIPVNMLGRWSLSLPEIYKHVENWGSGFGLEFQAFFSKGRILFKLIENASEEQLKLNVPDLAEGGKIFTNRREFLSKASSYMNLSDYIDSLGISVDSDFRVTVIKEFQMIFETIQLKLCPPERLAYA